MNLDTQLALEANSKLMEFWLHGAPKGYKEIPLSSMWHKLTQQDKEYLLERLTMTQTSMATLPFKNLREVYWAAVLNDKLRRKLRRHVIFLKFKDKFKWLSRLR